MGKISKEARAKAVLLAGMAYVSALLVLETDCPVEKKIRRKRRFWVHPLLQNRQKQGHYENLLQEMRLCDQAKFFNYTRMSVTSFDKLLSLVGPLLKKNSRREFISPGCRLAVTLRFLATGDSYPSLSFAFRLSVPTVCVIVRETCDLLWKVLSSVYLKFPNLEQFKKISTEFYNQWQLPNCIGALDGKHVTIQAPSNSGSMFFNYKKSFSILLMATCDANYNFTFVDIGAYGSQSDGGILNQSQFGQKLLNNGFDIPNNQPFPGDDVPMPFFFVGDEAFPLRINLLRPFSKARSGPMAVAKRIFNYRLSRARRVIENTFGILVARFRIFHRTINAKSETVDRIIKATVCLHNFIKAEKTALYCDSSYVDKEINGETLPGGWRKDVPQHSALQDLCSLQRRLGSRNPSTVATDFREYLKNYLNGKGADVAPWQKNAIDIRRR